MGGFSLLEFAILMVIFGAIAAAATLVGDKYIEKEEHKSSKLNVKTVEEALDAYRKINKRLPCPADPTLNPGDAGFGEEVYSSGACGGTLPAAAGGTGNAVVGLLPTTTLGLGENLVTDNWNNRFDYYLDKRMATENAFSVYNAANTDVGDIVVRDPSGAVRTDKAVYAIVSRGANQHGALTRAGTVKSAATTDLNEQANSHYNASGAVSAKDNIVVQGAATAAFDDIVSFKTRAMMGTASGGTLTVPQGCDSQSVNWTQGASSCTGSVTAMAAGATTTVIDSTPTTTGQVIVSCDNGTVALSGATCTTGAPCAAGTVNWTVSGKNCSASVATTSSGVDVAAIDSTASQTGAATATCTNGVWSTSATTCFNECTSGTENWNNGAGSSCTGSAATLAHGASGSVSDSTTPATGNVNVTCNDGVRSQSSPTCSGADTCAATTMNWTVGGRDCSATIASAVHGASATATDATPSIAPAGSGTATYSCTNGAWSSLPTAATCDSQCSGATQNWTVGGAPCSSAYGVLNHAPATNVPLNDASAPSVGTANIRCNNGVVTLQAGATCATTCPAGTENWTMGANSCTASRAALAGGASAGLNDTTAPGTGTVTVTCNVTTGAVAQSSVVCNSFANCTNLPTSWAVNQNCASQTVNWTVGGRVCSGTAASTNDGNTTAVNDATQALAPGGHGNATFTCNDGTFTVNAGATCEAQCSVAPWGVINDNASVTAYSVGSVGCGSSCPGGTTRTCNDGTLSGTGGFSSCSATPCAGCSVASGTAWTVGGKTCNTPSVLSLAHGASGSRTDSTATTTGTASWSCSNGTATLQAGATCVESCVAQTVNWTAGGNTCSDTTTAGANGSSQAVADTTANVAPGGTGSATATCNNGVWNTSSASCYGSCGTQTVSWSNCDASSGAILAHSGSRSITNTTSGYAGTRNISCSDGTINQSGGSCTPLVNRSFNVNFAGACGPSGAYCGCHTPTHGKDWQAARDICQQLYNCQDVGTFTTSTAPSGQRICNNANGTACFTNACSSCANRKCVVVNCTGCP